MTSPTDKLREVMREYLKNNVASEYNANEWWGWDTNVGDLLSDELLAPFHSLLLSERTRLEGLMPRETDLTTISPEADIAFVAARARNLALREMRDLLGKETV